MTDSSAADTVNHDEEVAGAGLTHRQILTILAGLMLGMFLAALDQTIVSAALPRIVSELNGLNLYSWVTTAYLLSSAALVPIYGKLSDLIKSFDIFEHRTDNNQLQVRRRKSADKPTERSSENPCFEFSDDLFAIGFSDTRKLKGKEN